MYKKIILVMIYSLLTTGCAIATSSRIFRDNPTIAPNEAIIVTKMHSNYIHPLALQLYIGDAVLPISRIIDITSPAVIRVNKIEIGTKKTTGVFKNGGWGNLSFNLLSSSKRVFTIEPGKINYIGDFVLDHARKKGEFNYGNMKSYYFDNEIETITEAFAMFPELFRTTPYVRGLPKEFRKTKSSSAD